MSHRSFRHIIVDILLIVIGFWLSVVTIPQSSSAHFFFFDAVIAIGFFWVILSLLYSKYEFIRMNLVKDSNHLLFSNFSIFTLVIAILYLINTDRFFGYIVFATIVFASLFELFLFYFGHSLQRVRLFSKRTNQISVNAYNTKVLEYQYLPKDLVTDGLLVDHKKEGSVKNAIVNELGEQAYCFFERSVNTSLESTLVVSTTTRFNLTRLHQNFYKAIINIKRVNDIQRINKFFEAVNEKLPIGGIFICMAETKDLRKQRILKKFPPILNYIYYTFDFVLKRVFPKFPVTKKIYFILTRGENRVLSTAELLGRLYSCGFEIVEEKYINKHFYVVARKIKRPAFDLEPTYGPIIKLKRIGKAGRLIKVYKMRTMHPYAEYLQAYVYEKNDLQDGGKFKDDFRISTLGRFMRKFWIDELPMFVNFFRGDLKLFGVRPLSQHYFNLYTKELQAKRVRFKPGLIPPFYVDNPRTLDEIMASEMKYLEAYEKHPWITDTKYLFKAVFNILFKKYRSR